MAVLIAWAAVAPAGAAAPIPAATPAPSPGMAATVGATPSGVVYYVATTGSDANPGSATRPWRTIQHAVDVTPGGSTITVRGGTYHSFVLGRSGLIVQGAAGEVAVVAGGTNVVLVRGVTSATLRNMVIRAAPSQWGAGIRVEASKNVLLERNVIRDNHSFGVKVKDATGTTIRFNEIRKNDTGIELSGAVGGTLVTGNAIHHNDRMVTASRGGNGMVFTRTTGAVRVEGNRVWGNRALHLDGVGYDGGAFEVYGASDLVIRANVLWDNNNVMETGTDGTVPCSRIFFGRNVIMGKGTVAGETQGMILRCADHSTVAHNVFDGVDDFAFYLSTSGGYAGSIAGLRIADNIVVRGRAYSIGSALPAGVTIDYDLVLPGGSPATYSSHVAYVRGRGNTDSLAEFRAWTGYDAHGIQADPRFVDRAAGDYHLAAGSPAIDRGIAITSEPFTGKAPDIGRYERTP